MSDNQDCHYVGIDVGTGSVRACIIDDTGEIKGLASEDIGLWQPEHGFYEQSTNDIWGCICRSVRNALKEQPINPSTIKGIGLDATCSLAVFSHDTDEPISVTGPNFNNNDHNIILWLDHRPVKEAERINATKHKLLRYVGGKMSVEMEIPKVLWLKNNMPPDLFARCKFYDLADALTHMATGSEGRSFCSTVCKQGYVIAGAGESVNGWQKDFLEEIGLGCLVGENFERIGGVNGVNGKFLSAGELVGHLSENAAGEMGLPAGIAVGSGVIDAYAGWVGTVGAKANLSGDALDASKANNDMSQAFSRLAAVAGTSTCHLAMSPKPVFVNGIWGPYQDVLLPGFWMAEGGQSATGELLKHILETHPAYRKMQTAADESKMNVYDYLNKRLLDITKKENAPSVSWLGRHLFFYGDLFGNRSPIADPDMRGSIIGLGNGTSVDDLALYYYATIEFIALQTQHIIQTMNEAGHSISSIFMSGSQCQNDTLMKLIASTCEMPVLIPRYVNAAVVHGAAMLGAKAASADRDGRTRDLWAIMNRMSKPGRQVMPTTDKIEKRLLEVKYKVFLAQCQNQQDYRREVNEAVSGWRAA